MESIERYLKEMMELLPETDNDRYRKEMTKHLPERDDNLLFNRHKLTAERLMANVEKEATGEAFMDIIDLNWKKCEEICRNTLGEMEEIVLSAQTEDKNENYWSRMKRLHEFYNADIGESLCSKMQFIRLEYFDVRQNRDFDVLMEERQKQAISAGANAAALESGAAAGTEGDVSCDATRDATASAGAAEVSDDRVHLLLEDETAQTGSLVNESSNTQNYLTHTLKRNTTSVSGNEKHFEKELKLRMTWGRVIIFWKYWIECRKESIDLINKIFDTFLDKMPTYVRNAVQVFLEMIESHHGFENYPLQFAHVVNKDLFCHKVLLRKLTEFLDLVKSSEYLEAFDVEPKDLFFNISTFQTDISARQSETCHGFEICGNIISREQEAAKLLACTARPLLHLKDLLTKLYDESRLNRAGIKDVTNYLQKEEADMSTMVSESLLAFLEVSRKQKDPAEQLRKAIEEWLPTRDISITKMKEIIEKLNKTTKDVAITQTVSASAGIVGGPIIIVGLALVPVTLGVSLIPTAIAGGVVSGLAATTAIGATIAEIVIDKSEMEKAKACVEEDKVLFEEVTTRIEILNRNSTMLLRYIPQDELESLISVMTDPQSTALLSIASKTQVDPRIAINIARLVCVGGKTAMMPVSRLVIAGTIAASRVAVIAIAHSIAAIGVALDIVNLVLAGVKLAKGAKSKNGKKWEQVVTQMEEDKVIFRNVLDELI